MAEEFRILPSSSLARATKTCPLLDSQSDREAWVTCCSRRFLPLARRIAGDNDLAKDILQDSWIRVLEHVCTYRGDSPACAWVGTIVRNCALDLRRERQRSANEPSALIVDPAQDPEALAQQRQMLALLREIVARLPRAYRDVCELRYGRDLSTAETACRLGISPSNVSTRLNRAVNLLKHRQSAQAPS